MAEQSYWKRTAGRRISRRGVLRGSAVAGLGLAGAALIGCGDDDDEDDAAAAQPTASAPGAPAAPQETAAPADQITRGGTFIRSQQRSLTGHFNPRTALNNQLQFWHYIGNWGVNLTSGGEVIPELFESWEVPGDGLEMIIKTRQGVKWHNKPPINGRAFVAEDAANNLMQIAAKLDPENAAQYHSRSTLIGMDRAEAIDDSTVKVTFEHPTSPFLAGVSNYRSQFAPPEFEDQGATGRMGQASSAPVPSSSKSSRTT